MSQIDLVFHEGCRNAAEARDHLRYALEQVGLPPSWREWESDDPATPPSLRGLPSPSIVIDGEDISGTPSDAVGGACRINGAPSLDSIVIALLMRRQKNQSHSEDT